MDTFKDRLLSLFETETDKPTKPSHIAAKIGMSIPGFMRIFNDGFIPKADTLLKIQEVTGCNLHWLLTGEGAPFPNGTPSGAANTAQNAPEQAAPRAQVTDVLGNPVDVDEFVFIPRYDVKAAAGHGYLNNNEKPRFAMAFRKYWVENYLSAAPKDLSVISVKGDSMEGVLNERDNILVDHSDTTPGMGIYVVRLGGELIVKRIQALPGGKLLVMSANEAYPPFELDLNNLTDDVEIIGRVVWFGRQI